MNWLSWQIDYLLILQNFRDISGHIFDNFFLTVTLFGEIAIPMVFICWIYWCVNRKVGMYILFNYTFGFIVNLFLKCTACIYRPWILDSRVHPIESAMPAATGYSFPSGHTAGAVSVWGSCAVAFRRNNFIKYLCITLILLVGFSRNYIGVHTPQDVLVSLIVGIFILWFSSKVLEWTEKGKNRDILFAGVVSLISIAVLVYVNLKGYPSDCVCGKLLFDPSPVKIDSFGRCGSIIGVMLGWVIEKRFVNFMPEKGSILDKLLRFIVGVGILYLINLFDTESRLLLFTKYLVSGIFITLIYPFILSKKYN